MDAGILAAFKQRYCRYHLQNAIDCDEHRKGFDIYNFVQSACMRWSVAAWNEILSTTIANCFSHTVFSTESVILIVVEVSCSKDSTTGVEEDECELDHELIAQLKKMRVRDPTEIMELLDFVKEDETAQPELADNEMSKKSFKGR
uniref:DDE-1 domain-containing protein n=1 Tax=Peronospora matthiolae TaxID=2874970 RepID=A0AAV1V6N1_9STRA